MEEKTKILLCEDDENLGTLLCEYLIAKGYDAVLCPDGEVGFREFQKDKYDICILDVMMPKKDGFTLLARFAKSTRRCQSYSSRLACRKRTCWKVSTRVPTTTSPSLSQWKNWLSALRPSSAA